MLTESRNGGHNAENRCAENSIPPKTMFCGGIISEDKRCLLCFEMTQILSFLILFGQFEEFTISSIVSIVS